MVRVNRGAQVLKPPMGGLIRHHSVARRNAGRFSFFNDCHGLANPSRNIVAHALDNGQCKSRLQQLPAAFASLQRSERPAHAYDEGRGANDANVPGKDLALAFCFRLGFLDCLLYCLCTRPSIASTALALRMILFRRVHDRGEPGFDLPLVLAGPEMVSKRFGLAL
jgi:hypothetical protein